MMDLATIRHLSREAAKNAAERDLKPFVVEQEDIDDWKQHLKGFPFPNIGEFRPVGWKLEEELFVDSSGLGSDDEPALSIRQLLNRLKPGYGYAITQAGQFQLYLGEFKKV